MSTNSILYLKEKEFVSTLGFEDKEVVIYSARSEINKLAAKHFFNISQYRKLVRRELSLKNKIPIYFSNYLLLFNIRCHDENYWINYFNILKICYDDKMIIVFKNGLIIELEVSKRIFVSELKKIDMILRYVDNL